MTIKVTILFLSCNRLEYLRTMLASFHQQLDFNGVEVYKILMDDYPKGRDDSVFEDIAEEYQIDRLVMNDENLGLSVAWKKIWSLVPPDTDYIWHQEDDFRIFAPVIYPGNDPYYASLSRPPNAIGLEAPEWYRNESDFVYKIGQRQVGKTVEFTIPEEEGQPAVPPQAVIVHQYYFNANPCLYPYWVSTEEYPHMPQESVIIEQLAKLYPEYHSGILGQPEDPPLVRHIGEYNQGKKVLEGEPGWDWLKNYDPEKRYYSHLYLTEYPLTPQTS